MSTPTHPDHLSSDHLSGPDHQQPRANESPSLSGLEAESGLESDRSLLLVNPDTAQLAQAQVVEHLELLAEQPAVELIRQPYAKLKVKKVVRQKTVHIPVTLTEEILVIEHSAQTPVPDYSDAQPNSSPASSDHTLQLRINNELVSLSAHQSLEILLYKEEAQVTKSVVVTEQVELGKLNRSVTQQLQVNLQHEELEITEQRYFP